MSEKEDIQYHFGISVKNAAIDLATDIIARPYVLGIRIFEFRKRLEQLVEERDQALAKLETVKVERRHLQALTDALQDGLGYSCFGRQERSRKCTPYIDDKVCVACKAISPLLKDNC